ncbi:MAG TPA: ADOP family duplicated permease [Gemmatimonadaceae bacterium]
MLDGVVIAFRSLRRRPTFALLAMLSLALGLGASLTAYSLVDGALGRPLPYPDSDRLVWIGEASPEEGETGTSFPSLDRWRRESKSLTAVGAFTTRQARLGGIGDPEQIRIARVSGDFFRVFSVRPLLGRALVPSDDRRGSGAVVVVSHRFWMTHLFGASPVGRRIELDGAPHEIVGVMPRHFDFPSDDVWAWAPALQALGEFEQAEGIHIVLAIGRLRSGISAEQAQEELRTIDNRMMSASSHAGYRTYVRSLHEHLTRDIRPRLGVLTATAALVLLLACANLANLLLAQLVRRRHEIAVRQALGESAGGLLGRMLLENLLLAAGGLVGGIGVASLIFWIARTYASARLPELQGATLGTAGVVFSGVLALITAVLLALAAYTQARSPEPARALTTSGGAHSGSRGTVRARDGLAVAEMGLSLALVVAAGVLGRTFLLLAGTDLGFETGGVYVARISLPYTVLTPDVQPHVRSFMSRFLASVSQQPGIRSAAISSEPPGGGNRILSAARSVSRPDSVRSGVLSVSQDYFRTLRIPVEQGRTFLPTDGAAATIPLTSIDSAPSSSAVPAIVDADFARRVFRTTDVEGESFRLLDMALDARVIGVVSSVRQRGASAEVLPQVYLPYEFLPLPWVTVVVHSDIGAERTLASLRQAVATVDAEQPLTAFAPLTSVLADSIDRSEFYALLLTAFAITSLLVAVVGLYGVMSLLVAQRSREMAIRMALGATPGRIYANVIARAVGLAIIAVSVGLALSGALMGLIRSLLYGIDAVDPWIYVAGACLLVLLAILASIPPARRAARVDPVVSLRSEG